MTSTAKLVISDAGPATARLDCLVVALEPGRTVSVAAPGLPAGATTGLASEFDAVGATGRPGATAKVTGGSAITAPLVIGVGLGDDDEALRRAIGDAVRAAGASRRIGICVPLADDDALRHVAIAAALACYDFTDFKGTGGARRPAARASRAQQTITVFVEAPATAQIKRVATQVGAVASAVNLARDLVNTPPNALTPALLAKAAVDAVAGLPVTVRVWDEAALKRNRCGGILGVGQGSVHPPRLVRMDYAPRGARRHLAIVGKGITFDTGGISIKPADSMHEMKGDMAGAAAVIAAMQAIATLRLPIHVTGWVPTAENMPGTDAQRPGDVITIHGGTTVEVLNTDAEGRLILADALDLAAAESPDLIVDVATLTGAQRIALGHRIAGVMGNDDTARDAVCAAADAVGEAVWPMPLPDDLRPSLESPVADLANIGERLGGMMTAGVFLREFIPEDQPWVHIDMAGPAYNAKGPYGYTPTGGTGFAVRTFVQVAGELATAD